MKKENKSPKWYLILVYLFILFIFFKYLPLLNAILLSIAILIFLIANYKLELTFQEKKLLLKQSIEDSPFSNLNYKVKLQIIINLLPTFLIGIILILFSLFSFKNYWNLIGFFLGIIITFYYFYSIKKSNWKALYYLKYLPTTA